MATKFSTEMMQLEIGWWVIRCALNDSLPRQRFMKTWYIEELDIVLVAHFCVSIFGFERLGVAGLFATVVERTGCATIRVSGQFPFGFLLVWPGGLWSSNVPSTLLWTRDYIPPSVTVLFGRSQFLRTIRETYRKFCVSSIVAEKYFFLVTTLKNYIKNFPLDPVVNIYNYFVTIIL